MSIFTVIADPTRRDILALLRQGEQPAGALVETLELPQPNVSKHLKALHTAGLVRIQDAESGATRWVDTGSARVREAYAQRSLAIRSETRARLVDAGAVPVAIRADRPLIGQLASICRVRGAA